MPAIVFLDVVKNYTYINHSYVSYSFIRFVCLYTKIYYEIPLPNPYL